MRCSIRNAAGLGAAAIALLVGGFAPTVAGGADKKAISQLKVADTLYQAGRYGEALAAAERAIKEDRKYLPAHQLRGQILVSMDALDDALEEFDKVLDLDESYTEARIWRGYALVQLKRYDDAMTEYRRALEDRTYAFPELIYLNMGKLHRLQGRTDEAIANLRKSVELNPSFARGYFELGMTYEQLGRDADSLKSYTDALVGMQESPDLNLRLGRALARAGNRPKAREHFEKVIRLAPDGDEADQARDEIRKLQSPS